MASLHLFDLFNFRYYTDVQTLALETGIFTVLPQFISNPHSGYATSYILPQWLSNSNSRKWSSWLQTLPFEIQFETIFSVLLSVARLIAKTETAELRFGALGGYERILDLVLWVASSQPLIPIVDREQVATFEDLFDSNLSSLTESEIADFARKYESIDRIFLLLSELCRTVKHSEWLLLLLVDVYDRNVRNHSYNNSARDYLAHCNPILTYHIHELMKEYLELRGLRSLQASNVIDTLLTSEALIPVRSRSFSSQISFFGMNHFCFHSLGPLELIIPLLGSNVL